MITAHYKIPTYRFSGTDATGDNTSDVLSSEVFSIAAEFITRTHKKLFWTDADTVGTEVGANEAPTQVVPLWDYRYTRFDVRSIPTAAVSLIGKVNSAAVTSKRYSITFAVETLLFNGSTISTDFLRDGTEVIDITYNIVYRPGTWNKFYREKFEEPQPIYVKDGGLFKPYVPASFTGLW